HRRSDRARTHPAGIEPRQDAGGSVADPRHGCVDAVAQAEEVRGRMSVSATRRPEDFLELVERARRGRLKLYVGFAAGVGKTYRMLEEAHELRRRNVEVVVAFVEPHGRPETISLVEGLEVV